MILWWATRSTALAALVLLSVVLVLGVLAGTGPPRTRVVLQVVHRGLSLLAVLLVAAHVATLLLDPHADVRPVDVVLPFGSGYRTVATGLGTIAVDLLVVVAVTSALRLRLGGRAWRAVHALAYALWPIAALHGMGSGTDRSVVVGLTAFCAVLTGAALVARLARARSGTAHVLVVAGLATTGLLAGLVSATALT